MQGYQQQMQQNPYGFQRSTPILKKFYLIESTSYQDQYIRPYEMDVTYDDLNKVTEIVSRSISMNSTGNIENEVSNNISNLINPSSNVIGTANIINGWGEKRFKFILLIEFVNEGTNTTIMNYVQGYSDFLSISYNDTLDPDMRLFVNTVTTLRKTFNPETGTFSITPLSTFNASQDELNLANYSNVRFDSNRVPDYDALKLARPSDILVNLNTLDSTDNSTLIMSDVGNLNKFNLADAHDSLPTQHLSKTIRSAVDNTLASSAFTEDGDILGNMIGDTYSDSPSQINFFALILKKTGDLRPNFTLKELSHMLSPMDVVPDVILGNDVAVRSRGVNTPIELTTQDTQHTYGADVETKKSVLAHEAVVAALNDSLLSNIVFEIDNYTGMVESNVLSAGSEIEGLNTIAFSNKFISLFINKAWNSITENNMMQVKMLISASLVSDTTVSISIDNRPMVIYRYPTFANSKYLPIIMDNARIDDLSNTYSAVISKAVEGSKNVMNAANRIY